MILKANPLIKFFFFPSLAGSFPLTFTAEGVNHRSYLLVYGIILRILVGIEFLHNIYSLYNSERNNNFYFVTFVTNHLFLYSFTVASFIFLLVRKKYFISALNNFEIIDEGLFQLGVIKFSGHRFALDIFLVSAALISPMKQILIIKRVDFKFILKLISYIYLTISVYSTVYPFIRVLGLIRQRFVAIRNMLLDLGVSESAQVKQARLVRMVQLHCLLYTTCRLLNRSYGLQLLLLFLIVFVNSVSNSYYVIEGLKAKKDAALIFEGIIIVFYGSVVYLITYLCKGTSHVVHIFSVR